MAKINLPGHKYLPCVSIMVKNFAKELLEDWRKPLGIVVGAVHAWWRVGLGIRCVCVYVCVQVCMCTSFNFKRFLKGPAEGHTSGH